MAYTKFHQRRSRVNPTGTARSTKSAASKTPLTAYQEDLKAKLMAYNGTFPFLLELRSKLIKYSNLSDKQWSAVDKCLQPKPVVDPTVIAVDSCAIPITVSPAAARYLAKKNNWTINPTTLVVTQIKNRDARGYNVRVKADWSGSVSSCRCCGKTLTDWRSQATGVGPYCVKRTGIQYVRNQQDVARFQKEMEDLCTKMGEVDVYIKKWHIDQGGRQLVEAIEASTPTKAPVLPQEEVMQISFQWCTWHIDERMLVTETSRLRLFIEDKYMESGQFGRFFGTRDKYPKFIDVLNRNTGNTERFELHDNEHLLNSDNLRKFAEDDYILYSSTTLNKEIDLIINKK
jgi:hypothetical protein